MNPTRQIPNLPYRQRGAVAIIVGLSIFVLIGIIGLAIDLGRLFVVKTELQNAADSCALAAARELDGNTDALTRATNAGITVGTRNRVDLQRAPVSVQAGDVTFSDHLNTGYLSEAAGANPATARYAMCTVPQAGLVPYLMQVLGFGAQTVRAMAVAGLQPSQLNCAIPLGLCAPTPTPTTCNTPGSTPDAQGLCVGDWYDGKFGSGGAQLGFTGNFNWIDFSPPSGGARELDGLIQGKGQCNLNIHNNVGQTGAAQSLSVPWNSRFGMYKSGANPQPADAPPDYSGFAYTWDPATQKGSWPPTNAGCLNGLSGSSCNAYPDFARNTPNKRATNTPYQGDAEASLATSNAFKIQTSAQLAANGQDRRLATAPVVDCSAWGPANTVPIKAWACVLMLHPMNASPAGQTIYMEYRGLSNLPGNPCATSGLPGGSQGPNVPTLVQ